MRHRRLINVLLLTLIVVGAQFVTVETYGQKKRPPKTSKNKPPKNPKDAAKMEERKEKQLDRDIKELKREYKRSLDKKTAKRMKRNRKRSSRHSNNRKDPFYKRWFSHRSKRVKKSKD